MISTKEGIDETEVRTGIWTYFLNVDDDFLHCMYRSHVYDYKSRAPFVESSRNIRN